MQQVGKKLIPTLFSSINRKKRSWILFLLSFLCSCRKWKESKKPFLQISNNNNNVKKKKTSKIVIRVLEDEVRQLYVCIHHNLKKKKKKAYIIERREGDNIPNSESSAETL